MMKRPTAIVNVSKQDTSLTLSNSTNKENLHPLQAHYQQYLMQQVLYQQQQHPSQRKTMNGVGDQPSQTESRLSQGPVNYQSSDLSLSQSAVSQTLNQDGYYGSGPNSIGAITHSNRSSHQPQKKRNQPPSVGTGGAGVNHANQGFSNSNSSRGTPQFSYGQKVQRSSVSGAALNSALNSHQSQIQSNGGSVVTLRLQQSSKQATTIRRPVVNAHLNGGASQEGTTPKGVDFIHRQFQKNVQPYHNAQSQNEKGQQNKKGVKNVPAQMSNKKIKPWQGSSGGAIVAGISEKGSSEEKDQSDRLQSSTNKHLCFDSIQESNGSPSHHQVVSSQDCSQINYIQGLISGSSESNIYEGSGTGSGFYEQDRTEYHEGEAEDILDEPNDQRMITLNNSLLDCVDQYGNQYSVLMDSDNKDDQDGRGHIINNQRFQNENGFDSDEQDFVTGDQRGGDLFCHEARESFPSPDMKRKSKRISDPYQHDFSEGTGEAETELRERLEGAPDYIEVREGLFTSNKKQHVSELNNPNSFLHAISKALQEDGVYTIKQMGSVISNGNEGAYLGASLNGGAGYLGIGGNVSGPNFVVCCSPSQNTCNNDDDCQYTNSSAARSAVAMSIEQTSKTSTGGVQRRQRQQRLIYTDEERKEEDLTSEAIDEEHTQINEWANPSQHDQFTCDNEEDTSETKLNMITGSSQIIHSGEFLRRSNKNHSNRQNYELHDQTSDRRHTRGGQGQGVALSVYSSNKTPTSDQNYTSNNTHKKFVQVLDSSDSRTKLRAMNDTPQVMQMIDQSNMMYSGSPHGEELSQRANDRVGVGAGRTSGGGNLVGDQLSPEVLGSRENRRRKQKDMGVRNSTRYLNFKDISPLVKSCNTFDMVSGFHGGVGQLSREGAVAFGSTTNDIQLRGKISVQPNYLGGGGTNIVSHHYPSVIQRDLPKLQGDSDTKAALGGTFGPQFFQTLVGPQGTLGTIEDGTFLQTDSRGVHTVQKKFQMTSPDTIATNKLSSMLESPPPVTENTPEKGIKDFNREYLGRQGMWPSKLNHQAANGTVTGGPSSMNVSESMNMGATRDHRSDSYSTKLSNRLEALEAQQSTQPQTVKTMSKPNVYIPPLQISNMFSTGERNSHQNSTMQSQNNLTPSQQQMNIMSQTQERMQSSTMYPNIDLSIVQKINTTIDNSGLQFYFKRPSDHVGLGSSSINNLRSSRDQSLSKNNASQIMMGNNAQHNPTLFNAINQSSFDDLCTIQYDNNMTGTLQHESTNNMHQAPLTTRSNIPQHTQNQTNFIMNTTSRFSNLSGTQGQPSALDSHKLPHQNSSNQPISGGLAAQTAASHSHQNQHQQSACCSQCHFEKEKRNVTQKAFERALGISLFLMEEIDKLSLTKTVGGSGNPASQNANFGQRPAELEGLQISRQEIVNLLRSSQLKQGGGGGITQSRTKNGFTSPFNANATNMTAVTNEMNSQSRFSRSKSQSMMPMEFAQLQRSLQIPRGGLFQNPTPNNMSYV